jgi:hypothetical protein
MMNSSELTIKKDNKSFKYVGSRVRIISNVLHCRPECGNDQVVIAAGQGATAAIDINKRLLEIHAVN